MTSATEGRPPLLRVGLAFAAVYLIWGSTYLAIRFAIETLPPFLMAGVRFIVAGGVLYIWTAARGAGVPTPREWLATGIVGALLLLGGNGGVVWAEQSVPSGLAAVLVATVPFWMVLLHWPTGGVQPTAVVLVALAVGLAGVALLVGPAELAGAGRVDLLGAVVLLLAALSWASGSLVSRHAAQPRWPLRANAMQQLSGGVLLLVAATLAGDWSRLDLAGASARSVLSLGYLVVFGSLVGFTAYIWLLRHVAPALVSTYAYVNPVVAVFLGWALAAEPITPRTLLAAAVIVGAVAVISTEQARLAVRERREREAAIAAASEPEEIVVG